MLSALQIMALLGLLSAFNVPQPTIDVVAGILQGQIATTTITITPPQQQEQSFGAIINTQPAPMPQPVAPASKADIVVVQLPKVEDADYAFKVQVLDDNGKPVNGVAVSMNGIIKHINTRSSSEVEDWFYTFLVPAKKGDTLTFQSGNLTKTVEVK